MSFQCYTSRTTLRSTMTGALFVSSDGTRRVIPDHWLNQAELLQGARLLRLSYSFCTIEIAGRDLGPVFEDAGTGKLGMVQTAPPQSVPGEQPWITSIVVIALPQSPFSEFDEGSFDA